MTTNEPADPEPDGIASGFLRGVNFVIWCFGVAAIVSLSAFYGGNWWAGKPSPIMAEQPPSALAVKFADRVSPAMKDQVGGHREEIVASVAWPLRPAVRLGFPTLLAQVPRILRAGFDALMDIWGAMNIRDLASMLLEHNRQRGRDSHPTIHAAARGAIP